MSHVDLQFIDFDVLDSSAIKVAGLSQAVSSLAHKNLVARLTGEIDESLVFPLPAARRGR